jgi:HB1/ASXL restriction endonuclease-like protein with HTH domain
MTNDTLSLSAVRAELARKEAEVEQLRNFLQTAETVMRQINPDDKQLSLPIKQVKAPATKVKVPAVPQKAKGPAVPAHGLTIEDLAIRVLERAGEFLSTADLAERMLADGYKPTAKGKVTNTVYATLLAKVKHGDTRIVKVHAKWGLREWLHAGEQG